VRRGSRYIANAGGVRPGVWKAVDEMKQPVHLDYQVPDPGERLYAPIFSVLRWTRFATVPAAAFGVWYFAVALRTTEPGGAWTRRLLLLGAVAIFGLAPAAVAWAGLPFRRYLLAVVLTAVLPTLPAEGFATLEERLFVARCRSLPAAAPTVYKDRWWPNGGNYLFYDPATSALGGGD
jgi:hypothetical protein